MPHSQRIAELLINIGAVKLSIDPPFTWTSGIRSPIYCDNRMIYSHPEARDFVVEAFVDRIHALHHDPDVIAGTATAAIGWAALVADRLKLPLVYVRQAAKEHGMGKRIEGDLQSEKHVLLIEDLLSTGGSSISSVQALREEANAVVTDIVAIFTYEMLSSIENAQKAKVKLHSLCDFTTLLGVSLELGSLTKQEVKIASEFGKDPKGWDEKKGV